MPVPTSPSSSRFIGRGSRHVREDLGDRALLVAGELERDRALERRERRAVERVRDARLLARDAVPAHRHVELQQQQLVVGEPVVRGRGLGERRREVDVAQRGAQGDEAAARAQLGRQVVGHVGEVVDRRCDETPQPGGRQPLGRAVNRQHAAGLGVVLLGGELLDERAS